MPPPRRNSVSAATPKRGSTTTGSPTPAGPPPAPARSPVPAPPPHDDLPAAVVRHHHEQQDHGSHPGIEPAGPRDEHDSDEFSLTDGYETASSSGSTSVTSSIYAHTFENGRRYQHFKNGRYPIPNDEDELNREDMKHAMLLELCDGALFFAPIGDRPQKILDIGTGTGAYATVTREFNVGGQGKLTPIGRWQEFGRLRSAIGIPRRASAAWMCPPHSPSGCPPMWTFWWTTAKRKSGWTAMSTSCTFDS